jgi:hypothetical protein
MTVKNNKNKVKKPRKTKYTFLLKNISPDDIDLLYGIKVEHNFQKEPKNITKIDNLSIISEKQTTFSYLDESKKQHIYTLSMIDLLGNELPKKTCINCYWCRHQFSSQPIGCPIKYVPSEMIKTYFSEITRDNYVIRENITPNKLKRLHDMKLSNCKVDVIDNNFYFTDGIFCSFNCCLAFIKHHKKTSLYYQSENLLARIYEKCFQEKYNVSPAPSWRLLKNYGGELSIEEFRDNFYKINYTDVSNYITEIPKCKSIGFMYEQKITI